MKVLVIHPKDVTTDFLIPVWKNRIDWTVIRSNTVSKSELRKQIKQNDRIICLGHGYSGGLFRVGNKTSLMIDSTFVQLLRKKECVFIWCNSDEFFIKYKLNGFCTGMIISEADEALHFCIPFSFGDVSRANEKLSRVLINNIPKGVVDLYNSIKEEYTPESRIEHFNSDNFYVYDNK